MQYRRFWRFASLALVMVLAGAPLQPTQAKLYKWVDENGSVTYSERKPPDQSATEIKVRTAPVTREQANERLESLKDKSDTQQKDREYAENAEGQKQSEAELFKKNCEIERQNKRVLENSSRIQDKDKDGNNYFLNPEQIQAKLKAANERIKLYCK